MSNSKRNIMVQGQSTKTIVPSVRMVGSVVGGSDSLVQMCTHIYLAWNKGQDGITGSLVDHYFESVEGLCDGDWKVGIENP